MSSKLKNQNKIAVVEYNDQNAIALMESSETETLSSDILGRVAGMAAKGNIVNRNKRYYSNKILESVVENNSQAVEEGEFTGELDHPYLPDGSPSVYGSLKNTAIRFTKLEMIDDDLMYEGVILNTEAGKDLHGLLKGGVKVGVSTRGMGRAKEVKIEGQICNSMVEYECFGIDAVKRPSNPAGYIKAMEEAMMSALDTQNDNMIETDMEGTSMTFEELKTKFPDLFDSVMKQAYVSVGVNASAYIYSAESEMPQEVKEAFNTISESVKQATKAELEDSYTSKISALESDLIVVKSELEESKTKFEANESTKDLAAKLLGVLKDSGVVVEQVEVKTDEVLESVRIIGEKDTQITDLNTKLSATESELAEAKAVLVEASQKIAASKLKEELVSKFDALVTGHKYESQLKANLNVDEFVSTDALEAEFNKVVAITESAVASALAGASVQNSGKGVLNEDVNSDESKEETKQVNESFDDKLARLAGITKSK